MVNIHRIREWEIKSVRVYLDYISVIVYKQNLKNAETHYETVILNLFDKLFRVSILHKTEKKKQKLQRKLDKLNRELY